MDERLKQRLVGAAVIAASLVIFVPLILQQEDGGDAPPTAEPIPPWPEEDRFQSRIVPLDEADRRKLEEAPPAVPVAEPLPEDPPAPAEPDAGPPPEPPPDVVAPHAWSVQLASFAAHENAAKLRDELRAKGFTAFERTVMVNGRKMTRVFVGPELLRSNAQSELERLEEVFELKGRVVRHPED